MKDVKVRNSNYELMRIVSMFLIVVGHILLLGRVLYNCENQGVKFIVDIMEFLTIVHVNSFVLVTGYFQSKSKFKQSKLWSLINSSYFYKITIMIVMSILGIVTIDKLTILKELFPLNTIEYWFIKCYFFLYCLSPFINKAIDSFNKKTYTQLLIVLFLILSVLPSITGGEAFDNNGYTLYQFIFMYLIGAYIRRYPIEENYIFKKLSPKLLQILLISIYFVSGLLNYLIVRCSFSFDGINSILSELARVIRNSAIAYSNPLIIIQSIAYFGFFGTLKLQSKFINKISSLTLGVYLIHENSFIREHLYTWTRVNVYPVTSYSFIGYIFLVAITIFTICIIIEWFRQILFKFIYNLKISEKTRNKYYSFIASIHIKNET